MTSKKEFISEIPTPLVLSSEARAYRRTAYEHRASIRPANPGLLSASGTLNRLTSKRSLLILALLFALAGSACCQTLTERIDGLLKDPALEHGLQGVLVRSLKTNTTLYEHNADNLMTPASNFKLLVSATALEKLGPDFTYKTEVYAHGKVEKGVIEGDLILKGGGDPVLETADLTDLAKQVKVAGISQVKGSVLADDSMFDDQRLGWGWSWDSLPYYYSAEISALNLNRNTVNVYVYPAKQAGAQAEVKVVPETDYVTIENTTTTGPEGSAKAIWIDRALGQNTIRVGGSIALGTQVTKREAPVTVSEPQLYAGCIFAAELAKQGVDVTGSVKSGRTPAEAKLLCSHTSPPLSQILTLLNKPSDNLLAEVLLKTIGSVVNGKGSSSSGASVEKGVLKGFGLDMSALSIIDGSGLSKLDCISPRNIVALLSYMQSSKNAKVFVDSLPIAGVDGTLAYRMKGTSAEKNVKAKTGYLAKVCSLSGYVTTKSGEQLVFSIMLNNHLCPKASATAIEDKICATLADLP